MPDGLETTTALNGKGRKDVHKNKINNRTIKSKLLKTLTSFTICSGLAYFQIIDIVNKYVYKKEYIHADIYFTAYFTNNIESTILSHSIMRQ